MKRLQIHRSEGLRIEDQETRYLNSLEQAAQDAAMPLTWPEASILRIFTLPDGRLAVVRETPYGLSQEAAPPTVQSFYQGLAEQAEVLIQKEAERKAMETTTDNDSADEA